jgi:hypothetical protein
MKKISTAEGKQARNFEDRQLTIGLDLGDRSSWYCVLDETGEVLLEQRLSTTPNAMKEVFGAMPRSRIALETGSRLSQSIINRSAAAPSASTYRGWFGSLRRAYDLIGYGKVEDFGLPLDLRRRTQVIRQQLIDQIQAMFPGEISIIRRGGRWRSLLQIDDFTVSVRTARSVKTRMGIAKWIVDPALREHDCITLLARLTPANDAIQDLHLFACFKTRRFSLRQDDNWLKRGTRMFCLSEFCNIARLIRTHLASRAVWQYGYSR